MTNINSNSELKMAREWQSAMHETVVLNGGDDSTWVSAPRSILRSALAALSDGRISEAVAHFDDSFKFNDYALTLKFGEKTRLTEFLQKARELFPDTALEVVSLMESGDHAIAEWKLTATQTVPYGSISFSSPFCARFNHRACRTRKNCAMVGLLRPRIISALRLGFIVHGMDRVLK